LFYFFPLVFLLSVVIIETTWRFSNPFILISAEVPHIKHCSRISIASSDTPATLEDNLPNALDACQEITDDGTIAHIPHLESTIRPAEHLELIVLEARDSARMGSKSVTQFSRFRIPYAQSRIGGGRDEMGRRETE
jgi:hypothetical protein